MSGVGSVSGASVVRVRVRVRHVRVWPTDGAVARRLLVCVLGVVSLAAAAVSAQPAGLGGPRSSPGEVYAMGEGGYSLLGDRLTEPSGHERPDFDALSAEADDPYGRRPGAGTEPGGGLGLLDLTGLDGTVLANQVPLGLGAADIPSVSLRAYRAAAETLRREEPACGVDWALLAGIGRVEANHGRFGGAVVTDEGVSVPRILGPRLDGSLAGTMVVRDTDGGQLDGDVLYDRAAGPMQFLPGTWSRWGSDGDRDGRTDPQDIDDAALAAARYLCSGRSGLDGAGAAAAVRRYNNSAAYVDLVLGTAASYRAGTGLGVGLGVPGLDDYPFDPFEFDPFEFDPFNPFAFAPRPPGWTPAPFVPVVPVPRGQVPVSPTPTPTPGPTGSPTTGTPPPTGSPSGSPSGSPTGSPSAAPTGSPTGSPTTSPTGSPTGTPGGSPTGSPSGSPSPTGSPTDAPAPGPTCTPSPTATGDPTIEPTGEPTAEPTAAPSGEPSGAPGGGPGTPGVDPSEGPGCPPPPCSPPPTSSAPPGAPPSGEPSGPPGCEPGSPSTSPAGAATSTPPSVEPSTAPQP